MATAISRRLFPLRLSGLVLCLVGLALALGGLRLLSLGGSGADLLTGLALGVAGAMLWRGAPTALWLVAAVLLGNLAWGLWQVGLDFWALEPRLTCWWVIAAMMTGGWLAEPLGMSGWPLSGARLALAGSVVLSALVGLVALLARPHDQPGTLQLGQLPELSSAVGGEWTSYGGNAKGQRYSPLSQISVANAGQLREAWHFRTGDVPGPGDPVETTDENTPLKVGNTLYLCTPHSRVIALDATTGAERWRFDPQLKSPVGFSHFEHMTCRGVAYLAGAGAQADGRCATRVFLPTADARLIALDAERGSPCTQFGQGGTLDLLQGIQPFEPGGYYATSPPAVTRQLVIVGSHVSDNVSVNEPSGVVRAFDVHDGHLVWAWDPGRMDDAAAPPGRAYTPSSPNMWSVASVDEALGLVYLPMGNQTPDQWGARRSPAAERYGAGVVALELDTGRVRWSRQFTHHDLWDMDVGGQPSLIDLGTADAPRPALVASTKQGSLYVLDRRTGEPIVPIAERPVPQGAVSGDRTSPTQPMSALSFSPPPLREADMWGITPFDQLWCRIAFRSLRYEGQFTPPSLQGTLIYPGNFGVFDWGGISVDPLHQVAIANPNYMAFVSRLLPKEDAEAGGRQDQHSRGEANGVKHVQGAPYDIQLQPFLSPLGIPCQRPPWGYVAGIDLKQARVAWQHKNGTVRDSSPLPLPLPLGVPSLGGTIVTAGGVAFLSGTLDQYLRAYSVVDGRELWKARLPAGGQATPISYGDARGRQLVVVVAGGHGSLGTRQGDHVIAYALPSGS